MHITVLSSKRLMSQAESYHMFPNFPTVRLPRRIWGAVWAWVLKARAIGRRLRACSHDSRLGDSGLARAACLTIQPWHKAAALAIARPPLPLPSSKASASGPQLVQGPSSYYKSVNGQRAEGGRRKAAASSGRKIPQVYVYASVRLIIESL